VDAEKVISVWWGILILCLGPFGECGNESVEFVLPWLIKDGNWVIRAGGLGAGGLEV